MFGLCPPILGFFARFLHLLGNPYSPRDGPSKENNHQRREFTTDEPYQCEQGYFADVTPGTADELEVCARQDTVANGLMNLRLTTREDIIG